MARSEAFEAIETATTFPAFLRATAEAYGDDAAVILRDEGEPEQSLSFAEIERESARLARGLIARGVGKSSRIGFIYPNGPQFVLMLSAISRIGAVAIPISTMIRSNELVRVLRQSDIAALFIQREILGKDMVERLCDALPDLREAGGPTLHLARTPYLRWIASTGDDLPASFLNVDEIFAEADKIAEALLTEIESEIHSSDQMIEIYTSGSMALPKGVKHNHGPFLFRGKWLQEMMRRERGEEAVSALPMFWVGGLMMNLLPNWRSGAATVCTTRTPTDSRAALGSVLSEEDLAALKEMMPPPYWGLGMSETLGPYGFGDEFRVKGFPMCPPLDHWAPGYDVRVADENDELVADGQVGEIQVRGYPVAPALHKIERAEFYTPDGYFHTGDMGLVQGKRVLFVGRGGDMIKAAGSNVSPAEVELEMQSLEGVHNAYVVGLPDSKRGQLVVAAVIPREGATLDFAAIEAELRQRLSSYKVPREYILFAREDVPMLHSNKVSRRDLAKIVAERLGRDA